MAENLSQKQERINVKSDKVNGSLYSQMVGVTVTDTELTLEFVYVNPRPNPSQEKEGQVVARITLPRKAAEGLAEIIVNTVKQHEDKKGRKNANTIH